MTIAPNQIPGPLRWAVLMLRGEAVAVGLIAGWLLWANLTAPTVDLVSALLLTAFAAGAAAVLWALGGALARCRAGARAPSIVLQLMLLPIGWFMIQGGLGWLGGPLIALGLGVTALLLSTPTTRALGFE
ncbi:hypothetical protein [Salinispora arenicola]|uniref:Uncharacterized protein n=2 Tax=Salinispora arenicola TaxID=168697 RepID=A0A542XNM0_SALAC|nr:hypothetical protein [Salinispora arenicola]MCN0152149.1 hypothetical protein [Salinispora arenicola]MCN0177518.1 hypothetical protein [Salinispora arenicola]NIL39825.1 hypothetical protein [Salinispora arenicola]NIL61531.1 hypothetical protein [Salinispora arenicola]TQL37253.1 hypothetical protein FB564_2403 [Salinispora arenicola]